MKQSMLESTVEAHKDLEQFNPADHNDRVLLTLRKNPAMFLSEIAWECGLNEYQARQCLNNLWKEDVVEQIPVAWIVPDPRLLLRVPDMSARNQAGFNNFCKRRWFGLSEKGVRILENANNTAQP